MDRGEILSKVTEIVEDQIEVDPSVSINEQTVIKDLGADSLDLAEIVMSIEDELGVSIDLDEVSDTATVGDFIDIIAKAQ